MLLREWRPGSGVSRMRREIVRVILLSFWAHLLGQLTVHLEHVVPRASSFGARDGFKGRLH